jgi:hypothetical protein
VEVTRIGCSVNGVNYSFNVEDYWEQMWCYRFELSGSGTPKLILDLDMVPSTQVTLYGCAVRNEEKSVNKEFDYEAAFKSMLDTYTGENLPKGLYAAAEELDSFSRSGLRFPFSAKVLRKFAELLEEYRGNTQKQKVQNEIKELKQKVQELEAQAAKL